MKKDIAIAVAAVVVVSAVCYGLAISRPAFKPTPSHAFTTSAVGEVINEGVVIRVNGEAVTENEFAAAFAALPEDMQQQFRSEQGKVAFAEQVVRLKLLEQEARRLGLDRDAKIAAQLAAGRTNLLADAAAEKLIAVPSDAAVQKYYAENKARFETVDLSHILIAYAGGSVPPKRGRTAPTEQEAMQKAMGIYQRLRSGADFASIARNESDDAASAERGGKLGPIAHGMLPQELEARVFNIPAGLFSGPIPSRVGIHIFKVDARSTRPLEQVRMAIAQRVRQEHMFDRVEVLRRNAKVNLDQKFFPDAKNWRSGRRAS